MAEDRTKGKSELKRAAETEGVLCQTHIGGQALIEGVMMRGKYNWAVAVRTPEGGIYTEEHDLPTRPDKHGWLYWPVIRGCRAMVESLVLGFKALEVAADNAYDFDEDDEDAGKRPATADVATASAEPAGETVEAIGAAVMETSEAANGARTELIADDSITLSETVEKEIPAAPAKPEKEAKGGDSESRAIMIVGSVLGIALGVAAFILLPAFLANLIVGDYNSNIIAWNIVDGVARVAIFILYIWLISFMKDIKRMFRYHGAEHKTIHCFEHGLPLTPENAQQFSTLHVRCGTAFLIMTLILAIIVFSLVPVKEITTALGMTEGIGQFLIIVLVRVLFVPLVAGLGYELTVKWAGSHPERKSVRVVLWPGLQMQRLTTAQPDDSMIECAIAAMEIVLAREEREARIAAGEDPDAEPTMDVRDSITLQPAFGVMCPAPEPKSR